MKTPEAYQGGSFCASGLTVLGTGTIRVTYAVPSIEIWLPLLAWHRMELAGHRTTRRRCGKDHDNPKNHFVSLHAKILQQSTCGPTE